MLRRLEGQLDFMLNALAETKDAGFWHGHSPDLHLQLWREDFENAECRHIING